MGDMCDETCEMCGNGCVSNSSCSKRYNLLYGFFDNTDEESYIPNGIPICDKCMEYHNIEDLKEINILGRLFQIDMCARVND